LINKNRLCLVTTFLNNKSGASYEKSYRQAVKEISQQKNISLHLTRIKKKLTVNVVFAGPAIQQHRPAFGAER
jgi:hypothetical protein